MGHLFSVATVENVKSNWPQDQTSYYVYNCCNNFSFSLSSSSVEIKKLLMCAPFHLWLLLHFKCRVVSIDQNSKFPAVELKGGKVGNSDIQLPYINFFVQEVFLDLPADAFSDIYYGIRDIFIITCHAVTINTSNGTKLNFFLHDKIL